ncbi:MAG: leucine-rich repeat domain-containing protein, partial [Eubacterium sp.]
MKKTLSVIMAAVLLITALFSFTSVAYASTEWASGDVTVTLDGNKIIVSGNGAMADYTGNTDPNKEWRNSVNSVTELVIEEGVTSIGDFAFSSMWALETVSIPNTVTRIGQKAFYTDRSVTSFFIPASVTSIGDDAFRTASASVGSNLQEIIVDANNNSYCSQDGILYNKAKTTLILVPSANSVENLDVPDTVKTVGAYAALNCTALKTVTLEESVEVIGSNAFTSCSKLEKITIKNNTCSIPVDAIPQNSGLVICGNDNSNAKLFADNNGFDFESLHTWNSGVVTKAPTCIETGIKTYTCTECGATKTEEIPTIEHTYDDGVVTKFATCTETGIKTYTCTVCDKEKMEEIPASGHDYDDGFVTKAPTCIETGVKTYTCTVCGATKTEQIPATGHTYDDGVVTKAATCTQTGIKTYTCTVCGTKKTEQISATGHTYITVITPAKASGSNGLATVKCSVCGVVKSKTTIAYPKSVELSSTSYTYSASAKKPKVTV